MDVIHEFRYADNVGFVMRVDSMTRSYAASC